MFKQTFVAFTALLGLNSAALAQAEAPATADTSGATCPRPAVADTADLQPVAGSNLMTVPVAINDKPKLFLLDISRTADQVSEAAASDLQLRRTNLLVTGMDTIPGKLGQNSFHVAMV